MRKDEQGTKGSRGPCSALTDQGVVLQDLNVRAEEISQENFSLFSRFVEKELDTLLLKSWGGNGKDKSSSNCCWYCLLVVAVTSPCNSTFSLWEQ